MTITRTTLERIKWALYLTIPVGVGYGLGSNQTTLEIIKRVFPNAASDPQGDHGRRLQTLEDAYREHLLERAVDAALADARAGNAAKGKGKSDGNANDDSSSDNTSGDKQQKRGGFWSSSRGGGDVKDAASGK